MSFLSWSADEGLEPAPAGLRLGEVLGGYTLLEFLGEGGMGLVYRARGPGGGSFALKVSHPDPELRERLGREAELIAALDHPGIVRIHDQGQVGGFRYLVCELIREARTLEEFLSSETLDVLLGQFRTVIEAIAHAHERGVIHRDVKAENVLIDRKGRAHLTDFGLGWREGAEALTEIGAQLGTPYAMSPEQLAGQRATAESDVWALGVLLYRILSRGAYPYPGPSLAELTRQVQGPPSAIPAMTREGAEGTKQLVQLCLACLSPDPAARPRTETLLGVLGPLATQPRAKIPTPPPTTGLARLRGDHAAESLELVPAALRPHPIFSRFTLLKLLGKGAVGSVHKAHDSTSNRDVALKLVTLSSPNAAVRFEREAEALARLRHPNVVGVHEVGRQGNQAYLVLNLVEGGTLSDLFRSDASTPRRVAEVVRQVAAGLGAAHAIGLVHRDVKPGNILLTEDGSAQIADFGVALDTRKGSQRLTRSGVLVGTPLYLSPEQAGTARALTPASDVFSLGSVLYEGLTGQPPFLAANQFLVLVAVASIDFVPLREANPLVPVGLARIVERCLREDPSERYSDGTALANALGEWLESGEEEVASRSLTFGVLAGLVLLASLTWIAWPSATLVPSPTQTSTPPPTAPLASMPPSLAPQIPRSDLPREVSLKTPKGTQILLPCWAGNDLLALSGTGQIFKWEGTPEGRFRSPVKVRALETVMPGPPVVFAREGNLAALAFTSLTWANGPEPDPGLTPLDPHLSAVSPDERWTLLVAKDTAQMAVVDLEKRKIAAEWSLEDRWSLDLLAAQDSLTFYHLRHLPERSQGRILERIRFSAGTWQREAVGRLQVGANRLANHPQANQILIGTRGGQRLLKLSLGDLVVQELSAPSSEELVVSKVVWLASQGGIALSVHAEPEELAWWDLERGVLIEREKTRKGWWSCRFAPDGRRVAIGGHERIKVRRVPWLP